MRLFGDKHNKPCATYTLVLYSKTMYRAPLVPWGFWRSPVATAKVCGIDVYLPCNAVLFFTRVLLPLLFHSCMTEMPTLKCSACLATARHGTGTERRVVDRPTHTRPTK